MKRSSRSPGFTIVEMLVASTLGALVLGAVLSSYLFLGRNLTRSSYQQELEARSRLAMQVLAQDARTTQSVVNASNSQLVLNVQLPSGPLTVTYAYDSVTGLLTRDPGYTNADAQHPPLLRYVTSFDFNYYDFPRSPDKDLQTLASDNGYAAGYTPEAQSIKQVVMAYTLQRGSAKDGTLTRHTVATGRIVFRNKPILN